MRSTRASAGLGSIAAKVAAIRSNVAARSRGMVMLRPRAHTMPIHSDRLAEGTPVARAPLRFCRKRFEDPSQIDFLGTWEDVRKGAYDAHSMIVENEEDGVWGSVLQPSQGLFWYRIPDGKLLSEICRVYNDWIADFCKPYSDRLKGIAMLNVDNVEEACDELERCARMGLVGAFIPVAPLPEFPYRHPIYERLWWTAQDLNQPLLLHISTPRFGVPANEFTTDSTEMTASGRSTTDYWVRYSMGAMLFVGVFDRYPRLKVGSVEHEAS